MMAKLEKEGMSFLPKEPSVIALLGLSSSQLLEGKHNHNATDNTTSSKHHQPSHLNLYLCSCQSIVSTNQTKRSINTAKMYALRGWEYNNNTTSDTVSSCSSYSLSLQSSTQSLSSKSSSQIHSTKSNNALLRPKSTSCLANRSQSSGARSVVQNYMETEPIPYKFEHHDVNLIMLHMDCYRKAYTYPNMEKKSQCMENQSQLMLCGSSVPARSVYSTATVRPKLFVLREDKQTARITRRNQAKQYYGRPSPRSNSDPFTEPVLVPTNCNPSITYNEHQCPSSSRGESRMTGSNVPKQPYNTLRTQYRASLLESASKKEKDARFNHSSLPLAQSIVTDTSNKGHSKQEQSNSSKPTMTSRGTVDSMTWVPERSSSFPLVITPVKTSTSLYSCTSPTLKTKRKPSNSVSNQESKLYIDVRSKTKSKGLKHNNRSKTPQSIASDIRHTFPFKKYDMKTTNGSAIPQLSNKSSHNAVTAKSKLEHTLLLGHRYEVNFRSKQPSFRYETIHVQRPTNGHTPQVQQPIKVDSGRWISQY